MKDDEPEWDNKKTGCALEGYDPGHGRGESSSTMPPSGIAEAVDFGSLRRTREKSSAELAAFLTEERKLAHRSSDVGNSSERITKSERPSKKPTGRPEAEATSKEQKAQTKAPEPSGDAQPKTSSESSGQPSTARGGKVSSMADLESADIETLLAHLRTSHVDEAMVEPQLVEIRGDKGLTDGIEVDLRNQVEYFEDEEDEDDLKATAERHPPRTGDKGTAASVKDGNTSSTSEAAPTATAAALRTARPPALSGEKVGEVFAQPGEASAIVASMKAMSLPPLPAAPSRVEEAVSGVLPTLDSLGYDPFEQCTTTMRDGVDGGGSGTQSSGEAPAPIPLTRVKSG